MTRNQADMRHRPNLSARARTAIFGAVLGLVFFGFGPASARADGVADFYRGKELRLIIGASVGGGYDIYARAIAKHLSEHIPGNPSIVPQDMPAGGGLAAANHIYNVAARDGTVIGAMQNTVPFEPFFNNKQAQFDATRLNWLGTPTSEVAMYLVWHASKIASLQDARRQEFIAGGAGAASTPVFYGRIFNQILGLKARFVNGYPGQNEILLAMESGEVEAMTSPFWSSIRTARPDWIPQHLVRVLFQYGAKPHPDLPGVPFALDLLDNEADRILLRAASAPLGLGRPFAAPPGVPPDRLAALRAAMMATFNDPAFRADCEQQRLDCSDPKSGDEIAGLIRAAYGTPEDIRKRLIDIYQIGQGGEEKK
jgi:tripartite-type tricarboxylate transporter receptor subunit TctC